MQALIFPSSSENTIRASAAKLASTWKAVTVFCGFLTLRLQYRKQFLCTKLPPKKMSTSRLTRRPTCRRTCKDLSIKSASCYGNGLGAEPFRNFSLLLLFGRRWAPVDLYPATLWQKSMLRTLRKRLIAGYQGAGSSGGSVLSSGCSVSAWHKAASTVGKPTPGFNPQPSLWTLFSWGRALLQEKGVVVSPGTWLCFPVITQAALEVRAATLSVWGWNMILGAVGN